MENPAESCYYCYGSHYLSPPVRIALKATGTVRPGLPMKPDITIYNATTACPVIVSHTPAGRALLARHYRAEDIEWVFIERAGTDGNRRFRALHDRIIRAHLAVRNDQASRKRLDELTGGEYSARERRIPGRPAAGSRTDAGG